jgi:hypothetical protein
VKLLYEDENELHDIVIERTECLCRVFELRELNEFWRMRYHTTLEEFDVAILFRRTWVGDGTVAVLASERFAEF